MLHRTHSALLTEYLPLFHQALNEMGLLAHGCRGIAASMVPLMSRGNDTARSVHIGANALTVALFLWQASLGSLLCRCPHGFHLFLVPPAALAPPKSCLALQILPCFLLFFPPRWDLSLMQVPTGLEIVGKVFEFASWP